MSIKEGFDAINEYFGPIKKEAFAKIGNPYKKRKVEPVDCDDDIEYADDESDDSDVEDLEAKYNVE